MTDLPPAGRDTVGMSRSHQVSIEGQRADVMRAVTALADADGVDLLGSEPPRAGVGGTFVLEVTVKAKSADLSAAVDAVEAGLPSDASITLAD